MDLEIYRTPLSAYMREEYKTFLMSCGLRDEEDADLIVWITDDDGRLTACGALAGHTIKQLAVAPEAEGQGIMATVVSNLIAEAASEGIFRLFLCTKPENRKMFGSMGFYEIISTEDAVLMENRSGGADAFISSITMHEGVCGAVVCNCDPFTLGHRHLIEHAAANCDFLYIFAVAESGSMFTPDERLEMIRRGTADIGNCCVYSSDLYLISRATFPAYFIKDTAQAEAVKADLDIAFFAERLAPALRITRRFVGREPLDPVTREYNERMKELLPQSGISLIEIPRLTDADGKIISAGRVRDLIRRVKTVNSSEGSAPDPDSPSAADLTDQIRTLVPRTTFEMIMKHI